MYLRLTKKLVRAIECISRIVHYINDLLQYIVALIIADLAFLALVNRCFLSKPVGGLSPIIFSSWITYEGLKLFRYCLPFLHLCLWSSRRRVLNELLKLVCQLIQTLSLIYHHSRWSSRGSVPGRWPLINFIRRGLGLCRSTFGLVHVESQVVGWILAKLHNTSFVSSTGCILGHGKLSVHSLGAVNLTLF